MLKTLQKLNERFGSDWLEFEPETFYMLADDIDVEKAMALIVLELTDAIYNDVFAFEKAVCLFNDYPVNFSQFQKISAIDILQAIEDMEKVRKRDVFADEVLEYIADVFAEDGIHVFPESIFKDIEIDYMKRYLNGED